MFFSRERTNIKIIKKDFLSRTSKAKTLLKRTFPLFSAKKQANASATVEALLVIPPFFLLITSVIWILALFYFHSYVGNIINNEGYKIVSYSYAAGKVTDLLGTEDSNLGEAVGSLVISEGYIKRIIKDSEVSNFLTDITCTLSHIDMDSEVSIVVKYRVRPFISIPGFSGFILTNKFYSKTYSGYSVSSEDRNKVYITSNSAVYHTDSDCRALKLSIEKINLRNISKKRNRDGSRYYACKKCYVKGSSEVFVTPYGIKYHSNENCSDLKLTVYTVWDTEIKGRRKCYFCQ